MIPQLVFLGLSILGLGIHLAKHGDPIDNKYNFFAKGIVMGITWYILYLGGFFDALLTQIN